MSQYSRYCGKHNTASLYIKRVHEVHKRMCYLLYVVCQAYYSDLDIRSPLIAKPCDSKDAMPVSPEIIARSK